MTKFNTKNLIAYISLCPMPPSPEYPFGADKEDMEKGPVHAVEKRMARLGSPEQMKGVRTMVQFSGGRGYCEFTQESGEVTRVLADPKYYPAYKRLVDFCKKHEGIEGDGFVPFPYSSFHDWREDEVRALRLIRDLTGIPPIVYEPCPAYLTMDMIHNRLAYLSDAGIRDVVFDRTTNDNDWRMIDDIKTIAASLRISVLVEGYSRQAACMVLDCGDKGGAAYNVGKGNQMPWDSVRIIGMNVPKATADDIHRWQAVHGSDDISYSIGIGQYNAVKEGLE